MGREKKNLKCLYFDCDHTVLLPGKARSSVVTMSQGIYLHGIVADFNFTRKLPERKDWKGSPR